MSETQTVLPYFLYSLGILFREGFEAMIVVVALVAGTREAGHGEKSRSIYIGALLAIGLSCALAWSVNHLLADDSSDTLEGVFQFMAAATLFYVSSWLTSKSQADHWKQFIHRRIASAERSIMPTVALGLTAFLAVMREGAETIVFFQALMSGATAGAERHAVAAGLAIGAVSLTVTFIILQRATMRISVGSFFSATTILLYGLAVVFIGQGVASWQESGLIAATFVPHAPSVQMLGLFPTVQTIAAQTILMLVAIAAFIFPRRRVPPESLLSEPMLAQPAGPQAMARQANRVP